MALIESPYAILY